MRTVLDFLKTHGDALDCEMVQSLKLSPSEVASQISKLSSAGDIICCKVTRFIQGRKIEGISCRIAGSVPKAAPGPKVGAARNPGT